MKEIRRVGWIGKNCNTDDLLIKEDTLNFNGDKRWAIDINYIYTTEGTRAMWENEWPPTKVEIIIREVK